MTYEEMEAIKLAVVEMIRRDFYLVPRSRTYQVEDKNSMIEVIIQFVCKKEDCSATEVKSELRSGNNTWCRHIIVYMCRKFYRNEISYKQIGRFLGDRDHATMIHGEKTVLDQIEVNKHFKEKIDRYITEFYEINKNDINKFKNVH
jgi:chromosomal replication initiator protein